MAHPRSRASYCRWCWLLFGGKCFVFVHFLNIYKIFPKGTLRRDVAPPVFKAHSVPGAPQQIIFLVSPEGKKTPSLLGFGCHIKLEDARANSTFPSVPAGKVRIKKASDRKKLEGVRNSGQEFSLKENEQKTNSKTNRKQKKRKQTNESFSPSAAA